MEQVTKLQAEPAPPPRQDKERLERERQERERLEKERQERERLERERVDIERERLERELRDRERLERERQDRERQVREQLEKERQDAERLEKIRQDQERQERERLQAERQERERQERERQESERQERERQERERQERLRSEAKARAPSPPEPQDDERFRTSEEVTLTRHVQERHVSKTATFQSNNKSSPQVSPRDMAPKPGNTPHHPSRRSVSHIMYVNKIWRYLLARLAQFRVLAILGPTPTDLPRSPKSAFRKLQGKTSERS